MRRPRAAASAAAVAVTLLLAACGGDDDDPTVQSDTTIASEGAADTTGAPEFNDADVEFAQGMIVHHEQAIEMADLEIQNGESPDVIALAERIRDQQAPEIDVMNEWLDAWGAETSDAGMDHGGESSMMSEDDMAELEEAKGAELDLMFLEMMIQHHRGAIEMAEQEIENGKAPEAKELARNIIDAQTAEIEEMDALLAWARVGAVHDPLR